MVACKDSHSNLKNVLKPYKKQIKDLQNTQWQGKQIRVFLFGDYDFLLKIYGLSGAQAVHPCLWCTASKQQTQRSATQQPDLPKRSLDSIRKDWQRFRLHGRNDIKKKRPKLTTMPSMTLYLTFHSLRWLCHTSTFSWASARNTTIY